MIQVFLEKTGEGVNPSTTDSISVANNDVIASSFDYPFSDYSLAVDDSLALPFNGDLEGSPLAVSDDTLPFSDDLFMDSTNEQNQLDFNCNIVSATNSSSDSMSTDDSLSVSPSVASSVVLPLEKPTVDAMYSPVNYGDSNSTIHDQYLASCKLRRQRRMMIVKRKRELGLIHIANSRAVRYQQKQATAFKKTRLNGKFSAAVTFLSVCSEHTGNEIMRPSCPSTMEDT
jgi:hypothetical protein